MYVCMYVCMFVCMGETLVDLDNFWTISKISIFQNMFSRIWKKIKRNQTKNGEGRRMRVRARLCDE